MTMILENNSTSPAQDTTPRIYVACLASYNHGRLYGKWLDATQDEESLAAEIATMLKASPIPGAEEYAIHDCENFGFSLSEYTSLADVAQLATWIDEHGQDMIAALYDHHSGNLEYMEEMLDNYLGTYDSLKDYLQELTEETGLLDQVPEPLRNYIDYDSMAHDEECNGTYTQLKAKNFKVYLFNNN